MAGRRRHHRLIAPALALTALAVGAYEPPSAALLEFLGEWQTASGDWVDPVEFDQSLEAGDDVDVDTETVD